MSEQFHFAQHLWWVALTRLPETPVYCISQITLTHNLNSAFKELHQTCETVLTLSWYIKLSMNALVFFSTVFTRKLAGMNASQTCPVLSHRLSGSLSKNWHHLWHPQLHCYVNIALSYAFGYKSNMIWALLDLSCLLDHWPSHFWSFWKNSWQVSLPSTNCISGFNLFYCSFHVYFAWISPFLNFWTCFCRVSLRSLHLAQPC